MATLETGIGEVQSGGVLQKAEERRQQKRMAVMKMTKKVRGKAGMDRKKTVGGVVTCWRRTVKKCGSTKDGKIQCSSGTIVARKEKG